jgi:hypothetical protein
MTNRHPKRAPAKYLTDAPSALVAVYDNGGKTLDRYTALYGGPFWTPGDRFIQIRGMSEHPNHPQGFGQWGEMDPAARRACGKLVAFQDLPADVQRCIVADCTVESES